MFKLTIEGSSIADLKTKLQAAASEIGGAAVSTSDKGKPAAAAAPKAAAKPAAPDFKTEVAPLILQLADKSRDKAKEVLSKFGVAKGSELKPDQYAEAIEAFKAAIEAVENDLT